jgi:hypothetical protein
MLTRLILCLSLVFLLNQSLKAQSIPTLEGIAGSCVFQTLPGKDPDEPNICGITGGASLWYGSSAPASGTLFLNTDGNAFDTLLGGIYRRQFQSGLCQPGSDCL